MAISVQDNTSTVGEERNIAVRGTTGAMHTAEIGVASLRHNRYETTIGFASGLTGNVTFSVAENVRAYRILPSADMRVTEDADNATQAEIFLETAAARTAATSTDSGYNLVKADLGTDTNNNPQWGGWSDWVELDKDPSLPPLKNLWFSLDAAGTGGTVLVETR